MMLACESPRANLETIQILVSHGADIHKEDQYLRDALGLAISHASQETVQYLVEQGANPFKADEYGTYLFKTYDIEVVRYLLDLGIDPHAVDKDGFTAYTRALDRGLLETAMMFQDICQTVYPPTWDELDIAVSKNDEDEVAKILATRSLKQIEAKKYERLVSWCCSHDNPAMLKLLADAGLNLELRHWCQSSNLHLASSMSACKIARWLLQLGFDVNTNDEFNVTPLFEARTCEMIQLLIDNGAIVDAMDRVNETPLLDARTIETADLLIKNGANFEYIGGQGCSLLMFAAERGYVDIVRYLLSLGANPNTKNYGQTAIQKAAAWDELEIVQMLLDAGADPNMQDADGWTALMSCRSPECAHLLVIGGADPTITNDIGASAYDYSGFPEIEVPESEELKFFRELTKHRQDD